MLYKIDIHIDQLLANGININNINILITSIITPQGGAETAWRVMPSRVPATCASKSKW